MTITLRMTLTMMMMMIMTITMTRKGAVLTVFATTIVIHTRNPSEAIGYPPRRGRWIDVRTDR